MVSVDEERVMFEVFYRIVLEGLDAKELAPSLTQELARASVDEEAIEAFDEVNDVPRSA